MKYISKRLGLSDVKEALSPGRTKNLIMMKLAILLSVLAALGAARASVIHDSSARSGHAIGTITADDKLLMRMNVNGFPIPDHINDQTWGVSWAEGAVSVSAVRAFEVGPPQHASMTVVAGGLGQSRISLRFQSLPGAGFDYRVEIWGQELVEGRQVPETFVNVL